MTDMLGNGIKYNISQINHQNGILVSNESIHSTILENHAKFLKKM